MFLACKQDVTFCCRHIWREPAFHFASSLWFSNVEAVTAQQIMLSGKLKVYWKDKESKGPSSAVGIAQVYSDKTVSTMKRGDFVMYPRHAVLQNFSADLRMKLI